MCAQLSKAHKGRAAIGWSAKRRWPINARLANSDPDTPLVRDQPSRQHHEPPRLTNGQQVRALQKRLNTFSADAQATTPPRRRPSSLRAQMTPAAVVLNRRRPSQWLATMALLLLLPLGSREPFANACHPSYHFSSSPRAVDRNRPFVYKERYPNLLETHPYASGAPSVRIRRNDTRFVRLVHNNNPDIVFKDEEGTGADHIMTTRCRYKLNFLAMLVRNYWPGVKVRVIDAWEERSRQPAGSLHYEGRAVDVTTSDRDVRKIPRLARLAVQAGFDWVHYESKNHVHASVKSDNAYGQPRELHCFPAESVALLADGSERRLDQLKTNDLVITNDMSGNLAFTPVIGFLHSDPDASATYLELRLDQGSLKVSPEHLVYKLDRRQRLSATFASKIAIGHYLMTSTRLENGTTWTRRSRVVGIEKKLAQGVYAPLTISGTMLINGVLVSNYAAVSQEWLAHVVMYPLRLWWTLSQWLCTQPVLQEVRRIHWYARVLTAIDECVSKLGPGPVIDYQP